MLKDEAWKDYAEDIQNNSYGVERNYTKNKALKYIEEKINIFIEPMQMHIHFLPL